MGRENLLYFVMTGIPRLRGHHLICLHFFSGKGYSKEFVENLRDTLEKTAEFGVEIFLGADDVCRKCPYLKGEKCLHNDQSNDEIMNMDEFALNLLREEPGIKREWNIVRGKIPGIFRFWLEKYCAKCCWENVCEEDPLYREFKYGKNGI